MKKKNKKQNKFKKAIIIILLVIHILLTIGYLLSAFGGFGEPENMSYIPLLTLGYPFIAIFMLGMGILWLFIKKKFALITLVPFVLTIPQLFAFFPVHFNNFDKQQKDGYTLMTYNAFDLRRFNDKEGNRVIAEIIKYNPDFVCMQECYQVEDISLLRGITPEQTKTIEQKYPHRGGQNLKYLSSQPTEMIFQYYDEKYFMFEIYKTSIKGKEAYIINTHLESIGLTQSDKELYLELTNVHDKNKTIRGVRSKLMNKLKQAFINRQAQADKVRMVTRDLSMRHPNAEIIICGDFNDTPYSYSYLTIKDDFYDAYTQAAIGPNYTYNADRFYFRIDHILYNGKNFEAVSTRRGKSKASDHYPLMTIFKDKNN